MRLSTAILSLCVSSFHVRNVAAFTIQPSSVRTGTASTSTVLKNMYFAEEGSGTTATTDMSSDVGFKKLTVYERLGFDEDKIAIGVNPNEVLQWLGK